MGLRVVTDVALREYLERLIHETDRRYEQRFAQADVALNKAEVALREYKVGSNEWRDALKDANNRMATRDELDKLDSAVQDLQRAKANLDGRLLVLSGGVSGLVSVMLWALTRFL